MIEISLDARAPNLPAPPPPPDALVRALIKEAHIVAAHMRIHRDQPETLIDATTPARWPSP
ncbi:MAG: hypothetical protein NZM00_14495 [Anaerolinea sp.]|nr:hypothetical protein [Anaerolinea sp.]